MNKWEIRGNRGARRLKRRRSIEHSVLLERILGFRGGLVYERHRNKIAEHRGYYSKGNVSHYIATKPQLREKSNRFGSRKTASNQRKDVAGQQQLSEFIAKVPQGENGDVYAE